MRAAPAAWCPCPRSCGWPAEPACARSTRCATAAPAGAHRSATPWPVGSRAGWRRDARRAHTPRGFPAARRGDALRRRRAGPRGVAAAWRGGARAGRQRPRGATGAAGSRPPSRRRPVSAAPLLALAAGAAAVLGGWEALAALERARLPARLAGAAAPLVRAGREGHAPTAAERRRLALLAAGSLLAGGSLLGGPVVGVLAALAGPGLALALVRARRRRYGEEVGHGAPGCARALADAL